MAKMIGRVRFTGIKATTDDNGNIDIILSISKESRYAVKSLLQPLKDELQKDGELLAYFDKVEDNRTIAQNSLMWSLLTLYADTLNGGRTGGVTPEKLYYTMIEKYGVATYLTLPEICIPDLKKAYRGVQIIDSTIIERNGKRTPAKAVKCILGSSKYTKQQMTNLIDGIFDELAQHGVDAEHNTAASVYYSEWQQLKG